jgi:putative flippase GtrA
MKTIIKSSIGGSISQLFAILISYFLDKKINLKLSNLIGNFLGFLLNFLFQIKSFKSENNNFHKFLNFGFQEFLSIISNQILFIYILKNFKKINTSLLRILIATFIFFVVSYPLRKLWVFKKKEE